MEGVKRIITIIDEFKTYLVGDGKSPNAIQSYIGDIYGLLKYIQVMVTEYYRNLKRY
jgi:hypothetical protein